MDQSKLISKPEVLAALGIGETKLRDLVKQKKVKRLGGYGKAFFDADEIAAIKADWEERKKIKPNDRIIQGSTV